MPNKKPNLEDCLQAAIAVKEKDSDVSIHFLAESFGVSNTTLQNRLKGHTTMKGCSQKPAIALSSWGEVGFYFTQKSLVSCIRSMKEMTFKSSQKQKQDRFRREEAKESS